MQLFHHHHHRRSHRILHSDFWSFELSVWLHVFGRALIAIFIPILLLDFDYTVGDIMTFYFIFCLFDLPLNFLARWLIRKLGARFVIIIGTMTSILFFGVLSALTPGSWTLLVILALLAALYDVFYWIAHIYIFMESSKRRSSTTKDTSILSIVRTTGGLLAPAIGAVILIFFNQNVLIGVSMIILGISIWPLFMMKKSKDKPKVNQLPFRRFFQSWEDIRSYLVMIFYGLHGSAEGVIWPVFIFITFETVESVAVVPVIVSITTIIFTFFAGKMKKQHRMPAVAIGGTLVAAMWLLRMMVDNTIFYYASIFLVGLFTILISIPVDSDIYERGEQTDPLSASTYRNFFIMLLKLVFFGVLALLVNVFEVSFMLAAGSMIFIVLLVTMVKSNNKSVRTA